ncbi:MAG: acetylserotonin O-methyltransferase [Chromatiaceae bacterium]|jgi:SAM-dependent methyltransferase|nr:acetylserotonin O-methyltransferase [Chromatiaceae bacterium]
MAQQPDPTRVMSLATQYWDAQVLLTANRIGLFALLGEEWSTAEQVAAGLATGPRSTRLFLNACVALGLLEKDADRYRNSALARAFLVAGSPAFMGNTIRYSDNLYATWGHLEDALRSDQPQLPEESYLGEDPARTRAFVYGMHERAMGIGRMLVELVDLGGRTQMLDVGGGPGTYSALFAQRFDGLHSVVLDLPGVVAIASEILAEMGVADRVDTLPGDHRSTAFPGDNDVVLISGVLHRESEAGCRRLIHNACQSLRPNGLLVVSDVFTDAGGAGPAFATLFGLNMLLTAPEGGVHADADIADWMRDAGLEVVQMQAFPPPMPHRVVVGHLA